MRTMLQQFFVPAALGLVVGAALSAAASQLLRRILYGVSGLDPLSYAGAIGLLATMATIAALVPARRALSISGIRTTGRKRMSPPGSVTAASWLEPKSTTY